MKAKVLSLWLIFLVMMSFVFSAEKKKRVYSWQELFPDPIERVYIFMKNGVVIKYTSHYETKIHMSIGRLEETLKKIKNKNYSIKEIRIIIHNHRRKNYFTSEDYRQYRMLKKYGFNGLFLLYCHRTKEVYDIEGKKKSN
ncbi:hypothetical protein ES702_07691 [subsurface metagenome]